MTELRVVLTLEALNAIAAGDELAFDAGTCRVFLSCDSGAVIAFHALVGYQSNPKPRRPPL